jgi:FtsP/CotA-like multicopper oxidase with cupredoxin domain
LILAIAFFGIFVGFERQVVLSQSQQPLKDPTELQSMVNPKRGGDLNFNIEIKYADNQIFNPSTGMNDKVHLRSYNGELVGPSMRVRPGQLLRISLRNNLPADDPSCDSNQSVSIPHCYNSTNLHTHGWHVSPTGQSDNVLLDLAPNTFLDYEYYLPKDHPAGTFWYHSHRHGSTALQVSSGMAGALIVEGFRELKDKPINGIADIDTILKTVNGRRFKERIFMFEQIQYYCGFNSDGSANYNCTGKVGEIESYNQFGPGTWGPSGRFTLINGQLQPLIEMSTGQIERWRLIHGGVRDTINFRVTRANIPVTTKEEMMKAVAAVQKMSPADQNAWMKQNCNVANGGLNQVEMAVDGLTRMQMSAKDWNVLQPGYRSDILMAFDKPGIYCALDDATPPAGSINSLPLAATGKLTASATTDLNDTRLLSLVFVTGGTPYPGTPQEYIAKQLVSANQDLPPAVLKDLAVLRVPEYVPHADVLPTEVTGTQELSFGIRVASDQTTTLFQIAKKAKPEQLDYFSYDPDRIDRTLKLGGVDQWTLTSGSIGHPFHIHVNPFQIIQILKPDGTPVVGADGKCNDDGDPQYCDMIGVWRDTLFIKNPNFNPTGIGPGYVITMRTRYERYIGDFVLHCHILDHEDQGMMENIRIAPIGGYLEGNPVPTEQPRTHMKH